MSKQELQERMAVVKATPRPYPAETRRVSQMLGRFRTRCAARAASASEAERAA